MKTTQYHSKDALKSRYSSQIGFITYLLFASSSLALLLLVLGIAPDFLNSKAEISDSTKPSGSSFVKKEDYSIRSFNRQKFPIENRVREITLPDRTFLDLSILRKPGFRTLIIFSAEWCGPCHAVWSKIPDYLGQMGDVVAVKVDLTQIDFESKSNPALAVLREVKGGTLPIAFEISPFGGKVKCAKGGSDILALMNSMLDEPRFQPVSIPSYPSIWNGN